MKLNMHGPADRYKEKINSSDNEVIAENNALEPSRNVSAPAKVNESQDQSIYQ